jgi:hypothetical protein
LCAGTRAWNSRRMSTTWSRMVGPTARPTARSHRSPISTTTTKGARPTSPAMACASSRPRVRSSSLAPAPNMCTVFRAS